MAYKQNNHDIAFKSLIDAMKIEAENMSIAQNDTTHDGIKLIMGKT